MVEERSLSIDMIAYEEAKHKSYVVSQGKAANTFNTINLDVHAIAELQQKEIAVTDDSLKYRYRADSPTEPNSEYIFEECKAKIVAIRFNNEFVNEIASGQECGLILNQTNFYAESGGQIYDQGFFVKIKDEENEFSVRTVYNKGGYILHIGIVEGTLRVGDELVLHLDTVRRSLIMKNHSATHALNHSLLKVLGNDSEQRGSLVVPEKLRFDFTNKNAMTVQQIAATEKYTQDIVAKNVQIYAKETNLKVAKRIKGLRSVFDEVSIQ